MISQKTPAGLLMTVPERLEEYPSTTFAINAESSERYYVYINSVVNIIERIGMHIKGPVLEAWDVLLWNSKTIHGSLDSASKKNTRSSITCHFIPQSSGFLQFQSRLMKTPSDQVKDIKVFRPKDLAKFRNRLVFLIESALPQQFYWVKGIAIKLLVSKKKVQR